jgi:ATP-dependent Clp protease ATP-binding subunit ClpA
MIVDAALQQYGHDLTALVRQGLVAPITIRDPEVVRVFEILARPYNRSYNSRFNPILIAEPGAARTALVGEIARRIATGDVPPTLSIHQVVALDLELITADVADHSELELRFKAVFAAIHQSSGQTILFVEDFPRLLGAGAPGRTFDIAHLLMPVFAKREIQLIGTATLEEYRRHVEKDAAIQRRMCEILVRDLAIQATG